jgi:hypothetical protein
MGAPIPMDMQHPFLRPEYLFRPSQNLRRLSFTPSQNVTELALPRHCTIGARSMEAIGRSLATQSRRGFMTSPKAPRN